MIPKSLLTTFLSLSITTSPGAPPPQPNHHEVEAPAHAQRVDGHSTYRVPEIYNVEPAQEVRYDVRLEDKYFDKQQQPFTGGASEGDILIAEQHVFPFDNIAGGKWNGDEYYAGVRLTNGDTSWIWSLPDAFPKIQPYRGMNKAWGPYPEGKNFSIYLDKPGVVKNCAFAYVLNGNFAAGSYDIKFYLDGKQTGKGSASFAARWIAWQSGTVDRIDIIVTSGAESGIVLLNYLVWEN